MTNVFGTCRDVKYVLARWGFRLVNSALPAERDNCTIRLTLLSTLRRTEPNASLCCTETFGGTRTINACRAVLPSSASTRTRVIDSSNSVISHLFPTASSLALPPNVRGNEGIFCAKGSTCRRPAVHGNPLNCGNWGIPHRKWGCLPGRNLTPDCHDVISLVTRPKAFSRIGLRKTPNVANRQHGSSLSVAVDLEGFADHTGMGICADSDSFGIGGFSEY